MPHVLVAATGSLEILAKSIYRWSGSIVVGTLSLV